MIDPYEDFHESTANKENTIVNHSNHNNQHNNQNNELTLGAIKDYLLSKGGKVKYTELYNHFRDQLVDSISDKKFQEFLSNLAVRKYDKNDMANEEWVVLKKVYKETSPNNTGFFASKLQKTKQSLTKISNTIQGKDKDQANKSLNTSTHSLNNSAYQHSNANQNNSSISLCNVYTDSKKPAILEKNKLNQTNPSLNNSSILTKSESNHIFEYDKLFNDLSLSKNTIISPDKKFTNVSLKNSKEDQEVDDQSTSVKSVKEHAKKLNRLSTQTELNKLANNDNSYSNQQQQQQYQRNRTYSTASNKHMTKNIELEQFELSSSNPHEKEWILICSRGDYMEMARMLSKNPYLAQKKDPFTTCAHWACKYGNAEILKLIASTLENDPKTNPRSIRINNLINSRTRKHLFTDIFKLKGAEGLVDYSGRQAIEYSRPQNYDNYEYKIQTELNDTSTFIKRSSSILLAKERESREALTSGTFKQDNRNSKTKFNSLRIDFGSSRPVSQSSPLALIDSKSNTSLPTSLSTGYLRSKTKSASNSEDLNQKDETIRFGESKENIFI